MTVLVCGGRDYDDSKMVGHVLDSLNTNTTPITRLVHGDARGADTLCALWAASRRVSMKGYPAQWNVYGKRAGMIRNGEMLENETIDLVVAFPGGRGTADMVRRAKRAGLRVLEIQP